MCMESWISMQPPHTLWTRGTTPSSNRTFRLALERREDAFGHVVRTAFPTLERRAKALFDVLRGFFVAKMSLALKLLLQTASRCNESKFLHLFASVLHPIANDEMPREQIKIRCSQCLCKIARQLPPDS